MFVDVAGPSIATCSEELEAGGPEAGGPFGVTGRLGPLWKEMVHEALR